MKSKILDVTHKAVGDQISLPPSPAPPHSPTLGFAKVLNKAEPPSFPGVFIPWDVFTEGPFEQGLEVCIGDFPEESDGGDGGIPGRRV